MGNIVAMNRALMVNGCTPNGRRGFFHDEWTYGGDRWVRIRVTAPDCPRINPEFLAAVFDVAGPTFRDEQAAAVTTIKRFDLKTQTFQETAYHGYKAHRTEMPPDLVQQVSYIRRALEAYRIPILESDQSSFASAHQ